MAYYDYEQSTPLAAAPEASPLDKLFVFAIRSLGIVLLLIGLFVGIKVILEASSLYNDPGQVERFARAVEQGSNLDRLLTPADDERQAAETFRMSYFLAWGIILLLFLVIGRLALGAIKTGGELALYDIQLQQFARSLVRESRGARVQPARPPAPATMRATGEVRRVAAGKRVQEVR